MGSAVTEFGNFPKFALSLDNKLNASLRAAHFQCSHISARTSPTDSQCFLTTFNTHFSVALAGLIRLHETRWSFCCLVQFVLDSLSRILDPDRGRQKIADAVRSGSGTLLCTTFICKFNYVG